MNRNLVTLFFMAIVVLILGDSCKKESVPEDKDLYTEIMNSGGYEYYKKSTTLTLSSKQSDHNAYFRIRFNSIAKAALTDNGKLPAGGSFPDGSVIVSELFDSSPGNVKIYAVMKKSTSSNAVNGWLWAQFQPDDNTAYSISKKGDLCTSCHSTNARDHVRVFNQFP